MQTRRRDGRARTCRCSRCARWPSSRRCSPSTPRRPERRLAQRALADELTDAGARRRRRRGRRRGRRRPVRRRPARRVAAGARDARRRGARRRAAATSSGARRRSRAARPPPAWPSSNSEVTPPAAAGRGAGERRRVGPTRALRRSPTCSRALPAAPQGQACTTSSEDFSERRLTLATCVDSVATSPRDAETPPEQAGTNAEPSLTARTVRARASAP